MATYFTSLEAKCAAYALCGRSQVKRNLLDGTQNWSLSDLKGRARQFSGSYAKARHELLTDMCNVGLDPLDIKLPSQGGKRVVIV